MGKGLIVSGGEDGLYNVEVQVNRERIDAEIASLQARIAELDAEIAAIDADLAEAEAERNAAASAIDQKVAEHDGEGVPDVEAELIALADASAQVRILSTQRAMLVGRRLALNKRLSALQSVPSNVTQQAWCADLTEDLSGVVATVEVPAEGVVGQFLTWRRLQIRPGYAGAATYDAARDGQLHHRIGQSPEQAYFNAAILPGVQRHRPQYRIGVITSIDDALDTCTVQLQGEDSSAQSLIIDPPSLQYTLTNVPIMYMDCNAQAFEDNDRVLIEFQGRDWSQPRVIGFEKEPRPCGCRFPFGAMKLNTAQQNRHGFLGYVLITGEEICVDSAYIGTTSGTTHTVTIYRCVNEVATEDAEYKLPYKMTEVLWTGKTTHGNGLSVMTIDPPLVIAQGEIILIAAWAEVDDGNNPWGYLAWSEHPQTVPDWASEMHPMPGTTGTVIDAVHFGFGPETADGASRFIGEHAWNGAWCTDLSVDPPEIIPCDITPYYYRFGINRKREDVEAGA